MRVFFVFSIFTTVVYNIRVYDTWIYWIDRLAKNFPLQGKLSCCVRSFFDFLWLYFLRIVVSNVLEVVGGDKHWESPSET